MVMGGARDLLVHVSQCESQLGMEISYDALLMGSRLSCLAQTMGTSHVCASGSVSAYDAHNIFADVSLDHMHSSQKMMISLQAFYNPRIYKIPMFPSNDNEDKMEQKNMSKDGLASQAMSVKKGGIENSQICGAQSCTNNQYNCSGDFQIAQ